MEGEAQEKSLSTETILAPLRVGAFASARNLKRYPFPSKGSDSRMEG